ncbi:MAG: hypothetical protein AAFN93_02020 [Bacteroidota bacterium]
MRNLIIALFIVCGLFSCGKTVELTGFDTNTWKEDPNGCKGDRLQMVNALKENTDKLKGLSQAEIAKLLGKPDRNELYKRNQKFFEYQIAPDPSCNGQNSGPINYYLSIRFNATGLAKELLVYQESWN